MSASKKKKRPSLPVSPPLETFQATLIPTGRQLASHRFWREGDAKANFEKFASDGRTDLDKFVIGNAEHLADAHQNAVKTADLIRDMGAAIATHAKPTERAEAAAINVLASAQMVNAALVTHMRETRWYVNSTMILLRTALELAARGGFIALGVGDEVARWKEGRKLPTREEQRAAQVQPHECFNAIRAHILSRHPGADDPYVVYGWLCRFTHLGSEALDAPPSHEDAYATLAYVAWVGAVLAEVVLGIPDLAEWPKVMPATLPWAVTHSTPPA